jgi:hypothetical protein
MNGYRALKRELGTAGAAVFLRQLQNGTGDYTEERRGKMVENSVDTIAERIRKRKAQQDGVKEEGNHLAQLGDA